MDGVGDGHPQSDEQAGGDTAGIPRHGWLRYCSIIHCKGIVVSRARRVIEKTGTEPGPAAQDPKQSRRQAVFNPSNGAAHAANQSMAMHSMVPPMNPSPPPGLWFCIPLQPCHQKAPEMVWPQVRQTVPGKRMRQASSQATEAGWANIMPRRARIYLAIPPACTKAVRRRKRSTPACRPVLPFDKGV